MNAAENQYAILLENLGKRFPKTETPALQAINATIPLGTITGLVGPDASGKTTLMRLMAGLLLPTEGRVVLLGQNAVQKEGGSLPFVGYMPQKFGLYEDLSVIDNLSLHAQLRDLKGKERQKTFNTLLEFTNLEPFQKRLAGKLSGGMKQKLGLACALLGTPKILLLDEPGVGVDPQSRRELWRMVNELAQGGMSIVWSTAYIEEAERCPHVLMLDEGKLIYAGPPEIFVQRVDGRTFLEEPPINNSDTDWTRHRLLAWAANPACRDVLAQGSKVRVLFAEEAVQEGLVQNLSSSISLTSASPRLEDAYMDAVGGISKEASPFSAFGPVWPEGVPLREGEPMPIIEAHGLSKHYGSFVAAHNMTFSVKSGQIFGLLGPNGAGKSTTFRMLCGLSRPTEGKCRVAGVSLLKSASKARGQLGYMAQKFSLYTDLTVGQNIRLFADLYDIPETLFKERTSVLVEALGLSNYMKTMTNQLPLGQRQRLALLCATMHAPKALFLDEPTSGVDPRTRREFWKHINALTSLGVAVLVTTHFMEEAEYCDEIALIYRGTTIAMGTPDELKSHSPAALKSIEPTMPTMPTMEDAFISYIDAYNLEHPNE